MTGKETIVFIISFNNINDQNRRAVDVRLL